MGASVENALHMQWCDAKEVSDDTGETIAAYALAIIASNSTIVSAFDAITQEPNLSGAQVPSMPEALKGSERSDEALTAPSTARKFARVMAVNDLRANL